MKRNTLFSILNAVAVVLTYLGAVYYHALYSVKGTIQYKAQRDRLLTAMTLIPLVFRFLKWKFGESESS